MSERGQVEKITERTIGNGGTAYSALINGDWLGLGFDAPVFREGDNISFDVVMKGKYKNLVNAVVEAGTAAAQQAVSSGPAPLFNARDISIAYQSARRDAITAVDNLVAAEAVKLPTKQADKMDAYVALVAALTEQLFGAHQSFCEAGGLSNVDPDADYDAG